MLIGCVFLTEAVGFSVGQLQFPIAQTPAEQTQRPELPFLQPTTGVSRADCSSPSFLRTYRAIWTPSSSPWEQASSRLSHLQVLQTPLPEIKNESGIHTHTAWRSTCSGGLTPERMTSPDSAIAPSLLSTYTTASLISTSSSSRQFGLQAPTAAQREKESTH